MDFAVIPKIKAELSGIKVENFVVLKHATLNAVRKQDSGWYRNVYDKLIQCHMKYICLDGLYFEKDRLCCEHL